VLLLTRLLIARAPEIRAYLSTERGQGMVEYALILFLISIGAVVLLTAIGFDIQEVFDSVEEALGLGGADAPAPTGDNDAEPGALPGGGGGT
jgi:Flp pilus assembly pilin Flp